MNNIRKFGIIAAFLAVVTILVPLPARLDTAFASETASDVIIQNARNEAEKLLSIRSASWLKFTDDWNAYLEERKTNTDAVAPSFTNKSAAGNYTYGPSELVTAGYLPASFPAGSYTPEADGNELKITVTTDSSTAFLVPNFLPMAEVSGGTITFKITRPGATAEFNFFVEKNAVNAMGNGGTIEWLSGNGLVAANTLRGNTLSSQSGGPIAVSSPVNITGNTAVTGNLSATGTGTVTGTLTAGNLTTEGTVSGANGNFTNLGATKLAGNIDANARNITGAGTVSGATADFSGSVSTGALTASSLNAGSGSVTTTGTMSAGTMSAETMSATNGNFTNLGATKLAGNIDANAWNITGAGTVSGATADFSGSVSTGALTAASLNANSGAVTGGTGTFTTAKANTLEARTTGEAITVNSNLDLGSKTLSTTGAVSTGALTVGSLNAGTGAVSGGTGNFTNLIVNTIESSAAEISVTKALTLGANALFTTGAGTFGTLNATNLGRSIDAAGFNITEAGTLSAAAVSGTTGTFTTLNATNLGRSIDAAGYNITGADTVSGTTGNFTNLNASNVTTSTLTLGGQTGTSASPYNVYVENATNAAYATNAGTATTANNSLHLEGKTLQEVIDSLPASGPGGIPAATAIQNRTAGDTTLEVTKGKWYKIQMRGGSGISVSNYYSGNSETSGGTEVYSGGAGASTIFNVRATETTTWSILYHIPNAYVYNGVTYLGGGTAVELKQGTTTIAILGGGGGAGNYANGGNAGVPGAAGGAAAGGAGGGYYNGAGGAAKDGTRKGSAYNGGSGWSGGGGGTDARGNITINTYGGGGGGSSYINTEYGNGNLVFEKLPALESGTPLVSIWVYN